MTRARLEVQADSRQVRTATSDLERLNRTGERSESVGRRMTSVYRTLGAVFAGLGVLRAVRSIVSATAEQERAVAQLNQTLVSTGRFTEEASEALQKYARDLQRTSTFGDEAIISSQALLLTFTQLGGEVIPRAQRAVLDVATAMGTDLKSASLQVGKALNDPVRGLDALSRSGIQFSQTQRENIRSLVELGQVSEAQSIILAELETQFGGSARAARDTLGGAIQGLKNAFGDLLEGDTGGDGVRGATSAINELTETLNDPAVIQGFQNIVQGSLAALGGLAKLAGQVSTLGQRFGEATFGGDALDQTERQIKSAKAQLEILDTEISRSGIFRVFRNRLFTSKEQLEAERIEVVREIEELERTAEIIWERMRGADPFEGVDDNAERVANAISAVTGASENSEEAANKLNESYERITQTLGLQILELSGAKDAAEEYRLMQQLGEDATDDERAAVERLLAQVRALRIARDEDAEAQREQQRLQRQFESLQGELQTAGMSPEQLARQELEARLDVIREFYELESNEEAIRREEGILAEEAYQQRLTEIQQQQADAATQVLQTRLGAASQLFGDLNSLANAFGDEQNAINQALFVAQKGFSIAQSIIAIQTGIAQAAALPFPANLGAMATVAGATAGIVSTIQSVQPPPRALGGQVLDGNQYLVGERGPEVISMRGNGNVTPNHKLMAGGGDTINQQANISFTIPNNDNDIRRVLDDSRDIIYNAVNEALRRQGRTL